MPHACSGQHHQSKVKPLTRFWPTPVSAQEKPIHAEPPISESKLDNTFGFLPIPKVNAR